MRILSVVGARPQFIKAAVVSRAISEQGNIDNSLLHTGQHYDTNMSDVFFEELGISKPTHRLAVGSGNHGAQTAQMLSGIERVLLDDKPDKVVVFGDTNSTLAGALAAVKLQIPVAHVEAGLRSFNRRMPEEINRVLTDHASELLFAPTETAVNNLLREGVDANKISKTGDVMYDAALFYSSRAAARSRVLEQLALEPKGYVLATVHRAENTDYPLRLRSIILGLSQVAREIPVVLPMHPRTRKSVAEFELDTSRLTLVPPVGYLDMVMLERHARLIATDSGGVQKEAYFYRVPCVTLRDETEWVELVQSNWNRLVPPTDPESIFSGVLNQLDATGTDIQLYGGGQASEVIARVLYAGL
jgi:UDP-GlcNAc3NAcA epimerase